MTHQATPKHLAHFPISTLKTLRKISLSARPSKLVNGSAQLRSAMKSEAPRNSIRQLALLDSLKIHRTVGRDSRYRSMMWKQCGMKPMKLNPEVGVRQLGPSEPAKHRRVCLFDFEAPPCRLLSCVPLGNGACRRKCRSRSKRRPL